MNGIAVLRKRILAVAASSRRTLSLSNPKEALDLAKPAYGSFSPVLVIGPLPCLAEQAWKSSAEVLVSDEDAVRLNLTASFLRENGVLKLTPIHSQPDNLRMDLAGLATLWKLDPPASLFAARRFFATADQAASKTPAVPTEYCSTVYCGVLNECVDDNQRIGVIREVYRVLRRGGAARFSVNLLDEPIKDAELLSEGVFSSTLTSNGYHGIRIIARTDWPVHVNDGLEARRYVFEAFRGKDGPCLDCRQAVIYRGPWKKVFDDDGHVFERDVRTAVCEKTFKLMTNPPYSNDFFPIEPYVPTALSDAKPFSCKSTARSPSATKAVAAPRDTEEQAPCCG